MSEWEDVEAARGSFIGWGEVGQTVTLEVVSYSDTGGQDFNGNACPQVVGILTMDAVNYRKGEKETIAKGEFVTINCGQASLAKKIRVAALDPGNLCRIKYEDTYKTTKGTDGKAFAVQVNRAKRGVDADELV